MKIAETLDKKDASLINGGDWVWVTFPDGTQGYEWMPDEEEPDEENPFA